MIGGTHTHTYSVAHIRHCLTQMCRVNITLFQSCRHIKYAKTFNKPYKSWVRAKNNCWHMLSLIYRIQLPWFRLSRPLLRSRPYFHAFFPAYLPYRAQWSHAIREIVIVIDVSINRSTVGVFSLEFTCHALDYNACVCAMCYAIFVRVRDLLIHKSSGNDAQPFRLVVFFFRCLLACCVLSLYLYNLSGSAIDASLTPTYFTFKHK